MTVTPVGRTSRRRSAERSASAALSPRERPIAVVSWAEVISPKIGNTISKLSSIVVGHHSEDRIMGALETVVKGSVHRESAHPPRHKDMTKPHLIHTPTFCVSPFICHLRSAIVKKRE